MVKATLEKRVEMLEETVGGADGVSARLGGIETRLGHVETEVREFRGEFLQFRDETRGEFSAVRGEMAMVACREFVAGTPVVATNLFVLEDGHWRMAHHHGSPVALARG